MCPRKVVFNVTHYMDYHPGGWDELVRGAGRDATDMFNEIHRCKYHFISKRLIQFSFRWVNYQGLLEACVVGKLVEGEPALPNLPPPTMQPPKNGTLNIKHRRGPKTGVDIDEALQLSPHHHSSDIWHLGYFHTAGVKSKILGLIPWLCSGSASKSCLVSRTCTLFSFNACP